MDNDLEKAIDDAGRGVVFELAAKNGWSYPNMPPKWVWWGLVYEANRVTLQESGIAQD